MRFIKRLMEIKEEQLRYEEAQKYYIEEMDTTLKRILEELKRGFKKNGNNNKNHRK